MKKRFLAALLLGMATLSFSSCSSVEALKQTILDKLDSDTITIESENENGNLSSEKTLSGATIPDGTLKDSRLNEQEKPFVGFWKSEDGHMLAIREAAVKEDMPDEFPLDAIILFPYVNEKMGRENSWDIITRGNGRLDIQEQDDKLILQDTQQCPADDDYSSTHMTTEELVYDALTDTITYHMLVEGEAYSWDGADGYIDQVVFQRTDQDIEEANWDEYYISEGWRIGRDPR